MAKENLSIQIEYEKKEGGVVLKKLHGRCAELHVPAKICLLYTSAQKFETAFYAKPDLRNVRPPEEPAKSEPATLDLESLVEQLQKSPELASALAALIAAQAPAK